MAGFKQTLVHKPGKKSFHQVSFFTGQPIACFSGKDPLSQLLSYAGQLGYDGVELASWQLALSRARDDQGAALYAFELFETCRDFGLEIVSLAAHLQGQCLGDRATAKTIQFQGGEIAAAYAEWRKAGHTPPADNPFWIPDEIAVMSRRQATEDLLATGRLAFHIGKLSDRQVPVSGFTGSAGAWDEVSDFPPRPKDIGGISFPDRIGQAFDVLSERFCPIFDLYKKLDVRFGLECHPGEIAMGDLYSAGRTLDHFTKLGYGDVFGFNFDASHMIWQGVDPIAFIREFGDHIWSVHHKGAQVRMGTTWRGILGGFGGFGSSQRGWEFVCASSESDSTSPEGILAALNGNGFDGAITIELEDTRFDLRECMPLALARLQAIDLSPPEGAFDRAFAKE